MPISKETYLSASAIAEDLHNRGIHLVASQSSVLSELIDLSVSPETIQSTMPKTLIGNPGISTTPTYMEDPEGRADTVFYATHGYEVQSQHDLKIEALADDISRYVQQHIGFARGTVVPLVSSLADKLSHFLQSAKPLDPVSMFEVVQREIPAIVLDESFIAGGLENYTGKFMEWSSFPGMIDVSDDPEFYSGLMNVGNERQNGLVRQWLLGLPPDYIKQIFIRVFSNQQYSETDKASECILSDPGKYSNPYDTIDHALAIYIMGNRLMNEVQPAQGVPLMKYKQAMRDIIDYAGNMLVAGIKTATRQIEGRTLVSEAVISKKRIVVNKSIYKGWLAEGGAPEILYGMMASGNIQYGIDAINAIKEKARSQWGLYIALTQTEIKADMRRRFRAFVESEVLNGLNELSELEKDYMAGRSGIKDKIAQMVHAELDCLGDGAMDDVYHTALLLIAKCRFFYTSSYLMLKEMGEVAKENPDIDQREAALLGAAIGYLSMYFADQTSTK